MGKKTKVEALKDLAAIRGSVPKGLLKGRPKSVLDAATLGAGALIMLDPLDLLADQRIVLPLDMVAIPAYQAYLIQGSPSMQIYIRAGETIIPTGGNVRDVEEALDEALTPVVEETGVRMKKQSTKYQRKYRKAFAQVAPKYKLKNGKWKKNGFKAAVRAAHKKAKGGK